MRSDNLKKGVERTPHKALLKALGLTDSEMQRPYIAVVNSANDYVAGHMHLHEIAKSVISLLNSILTGIVNATVTFSMGLFSLIVNLLLAIVFSFYVIGQKENLGNQGYRIVYAIFPPLWADRFRRFIQLAHRSFSNFLAGQVVEAIIFGCLITLALAIFNFPYTVLIGVLSGCLALIPVLGAWVSGIIGALLMLTVRPMTAITFLIIFLVVQQIEGNLIYPFVVGKRVGLAPIWVLAAVVIGGSTGGILGAFISIPIFSIIYDLLGRLINRRLKERPVHANQLAVSRQASKEATENKKNTQFSFIDRMRFFGMRLRKRFRSKSSPDIPTGDEKDRTTQTQRADSHDENHDDNQKVKPNKRKENSADSPKGFPDNMNLDQ